ncbi:hypothetical protein KFK09_020068 [Dendrobium nobile]|uniref:Uncharacterized protein n=1 Tax=Dendrobium nobile TaxID=94219 RepID=A0A8T3ARA1_DENNO|nr:hypothetical protein KFK09_020068 [Dendrobium nobile]
MDWSSLGDALSPNPKYQSSMNSQNPHVDVLAKPISFFLQQLLSIETLSAILQPRRRAALKPSIKRLYMSSLKRLLHCDLPHRRSASPPFRVLAPCLAT